MWTLFRVACSLPVLLLVLVAVYSLVRWHRVRTAKRISIAEAARRGGVCEIGGTVEPRELSEDPAVEGPVAYAEVYVEAELDPERARGGKKKVRVRYEVGDSIWVRDDTGLARVVAFGTEVHVGGEEKDLDWVRTEGAEVPGWLRHALVREDVDPASVRRATGSVDVVRPGDPLYVLGYAEPEHTGDAMYRDPQLVPVFRQRRSKPLHVANMEERRVQSFELGCGVGALAGAGLVALVWLAVFGGLW